MQPLVEALRNAAAMLPSAAEASNDHPQEHRARAALAILIERASRVEGQASASPPESTMAGLSCPNCGRSVASAKSPYCSCECREEAGFVRQLRASVLSGTLADHDRQVALGQKFWRMLGGGLPLRLSLIPPKAWERFLEKSGGTCAICGAPATTIDNIGGG